jgi:hypothetical protein
VAAPVWTPGGPVVANVWSLPALVPVAFDATIRKWYVVPAARRLTGIETVEVLLPEPTFFAVVFVP